MKGIPENNKRRKSSFMSVLHGVGIVVPIAASGVIAIAARSYLQNLWGLAPQTYTSGVIVLVGTVTMLSTRKLRMHLRDQITNANARTEELSSYTSPQNRQDVLAKTTYKYPPRVSFLLAILGVIFSAMPYIGSEVGKSTAHHALYYAIACPFFMIAFHVYTYSVVIKPPKIIIRTFNYWKREIDMADIVKASVFRNQYGSPQAVVTLKSGKRLRFSYMLSNFSGLLDNLGVQDKGTHQGS